MNKRAGTLYFFCGRLAAGKTTLARKISAAESAVFFCEDTWLSKLSPGIRSFEDYLDWSRRCRAVMGPLIIQILKSGSSVVLDFGGNTVRERSWVRSLFEAAGSNHVLHYLDLPEEVCLAQLMARNKNQPEGLYFATTTEEEFRQISAYFQPPSPEEGFNLQTKIVH
ncbi:MAG TPA: ATP-binding protein [Edaphobacter sp.]